MITGVKVDITIKDNVTGKYLSIPVIPQTISLDSGDAIATTVTVLKLGEVAFPNGVNLDAVSWTSFFPARYDASYCKYTALKKPSEYAEQLTAWKAKGTSLQLIIPAANINQAVYVNSYKGSLEGFEGDILYSVSLKELKNIRPIQLPITVVPRPIPPKPKPTPAARPAAPKKAVTKTYTVKRGDCLYNIAKKLGIKDWHTIYNWNKAKIKNPNLIYPGQVFRVS